MRKVANFILFQAAWFACVLGVDRGWTWAGPAFVGLCVVAHLLWISTDRRRDALSLALLPLIGLVVDSALLHANVLHYRGEMLLGWFAPAWIFALWFSFVTTFTSSMSWLQGRYALAAAFGAVGAPLSYAGGVRAAALGYGEPLWLCVLAVACAWGIAMPLCLWLSARFAQSSNAA